MANFFDKLTSELNKGVASVSESSRLILEKANINTQIKNSHKEKTQLLEDIGTIVYNLYTRGKITIESCEAMFDSVTKIDERIDKLQERIEELETSKNHYDK